MTQFVVAGSIALLSACGQKGPLFIPVKPIQSSPVEKPAPTSVTAPISSTKDAK
ncbi:MAG: lipoprotein [Cytophaga sp.]|nr:lipoprotein [Undibacterium sp.]